MYSKIYQFYDCDGINWKYCLLVFISSFLQKYLKMYLHWIFKMIMKNIMANFER